MKKTRNRRSKPPLQLSGATLSFWQASADLLRWAQTSPQFRIALTVLINERVNVCSGYGPITESRRLGQLEGYDHAIEILQSLARGPEKPPEPLPDPDYGAADAELRMRETVSDI